MLVSIEVLVLEILPQVVACGVLGCGSYTRRVLNLEGNVLEETLVGGWHDVLETEVHAGLGSHALCCNFGLASDV